MGSNLVEASDFFLGFLCNCLSCFTTAKITFTSTGVFCYVIQLNGLLTRKRGLGSLSASLGMSIVPHLYASSALFRFQASRYNVAQTMLKMLKAKMHQSRVASPLLERTNVTMPRKAGAINHLVYMPSHAKYMAIFTPKYRQMSSEKKGSSLKGLSQPLLCFCLHLGTRLTQLLEISFKKYLLTKRNS